MAFPFKKAAAPAAPIVPRPARDELRARIWQIKANREKYAAVAAKDATAAADELPAQTAQARINNLVGRVDEANARARYADGSDAEVKVLADELAAAQRELVKLDGIARAARTVRDGYRQRMRELDSQHAAMMATMDSMTVNALMEVVAERKAGYTAAVEAMKQALGHALAPAIAADVIASTRGWPQSGALKLLAQFQTVEIFPEGSPVEIGDRLKWGESLKERQKADVQRVLYVQAAGQRLVQKLLEGEEIA